MANTTGNTISTAGIASITVSVTSPAIDSNHPYHLHSSDAPGMSLVNNLFDGKGYQGWKRSVLIAISAKNKLGFITGTQAAPAAGSSDQSSWSRCNDMVTSWLLNSLLKEIPDSVIYSTTAKELWTSLEHRFGQTNGAKLFHLQKELSSLTQENSTIAGYFTKLKKLLDELDSLNSNVKCNCVCTCEGKQKLEKSMEDERLIQFLMGLNDAYAHARGNILIIDDCFRLIGFPDDFAFTNDKNVHGQIRSNNVAVSDEAESKNNNQLDNINLNPTQQHKQDQYNQFILMYNRMKMEEIANTNTGSDINSNAVAGLLNEESSSFW